MTPITSVVVALEAWEYEHAYSVGIRRFTENWGKQDAPHYQDKSVLMPDCQASPMSAICEIAVAKYTNQYWHGHVWDKRLHEQFRNMPDVGDRIEVRMVVKNRGVCARQRDIGKQIWAARIEDEENRTVRILGFVEFDVARLYLNGHRMGYVPFSVLSAPETSEFVKTHEKECEASA